MKDRFSRLLAACELLTRDESAALANRDLAALGRTHRVKSVILADLAVEAGLVRPSRDSHALARLTHLLQCNRQNSLRLAGLKAATAEKLRKVRAAGNQLQTLRSAYTLVDRPRRQAFSAHG